MYLSNYSSFQILKLHYLPTNVISILSIFIEAFIHTVDEPPPPPKKMNHILIELCLENYMHIFWKNLMGNFYKL